MLHRSMLHQRPAAASCAAASTGATAPAPGATTSCCPTRGSRASELDAGQQQLLLELIDVFVGRKAAPHAALEIERVRRHLDETHFAWIGDPAADGPFYYRVHSPVILLEFDHHAGIFLTARSRSRSTSTRSCARPTAATTGSSCCASSTPAAHVPPVTAGSIPTIASTSEVSGWIGGSVP